MRVLILFATYSSGTQTAAEFLADFLREKGCEVDLRQVSEMATDDISKADLIIMGSPSWERENFKYNGQPHYDYFKLFASYGYDADLPEEMRTTNTRWEGKKVAIFGLGEKNYPVFCGAVDYLEDFVEKLGGQLVVPSLRVNQFYFHQAENEQQLEHWVRLILEQGT
jgi:flavodoxin I